jgi:subtilisin family serine protease
MVNKHYIILTVIVAILFSISACDSTLRNESETQSQQETNQTESNVIPGQYIVVIENGKTISKAPDKQQAVNRASANRGVDRDAFIQSANKMLSDVGIEQSAVKNYYSHAVSGFTVEADKKSMEELQKDPRVKYIEQDQMMTLDPIDSDGGALPDAAEKGDNASAPGDFVPYGVTRVGGAADGTGKFAWVIDSGIDLDHPDLNVNTEYSESFVNSESSPNDQNGHGTHVAGTIGALSDGNGVIGVAPNTTLFAVKVLPAGGSGPYSAIIAGVDYVAQNAFSGEVANMSLGGPPSRALDDAVQNLANAGVEIALAAGNESTNAGNKSPARVNGQNILTVSAINSNDSFATGFSNFGNPPVDWAAPGVGVWSTWLNGQYNQISGTSMASPHVAGLLVGGGITADGNANNDPDGNADPISVRN